MEPFYSAITRDYRVVALGGPREHWGALTENMARRRTIIRVGAANLEDEVAPPALVTMDSPQQATATTNVHTHTHLRLGHALGDHQRDVACTRDAGDYHAGTFVCALTGLVLLQELLRLAELVVRPSRDAEHLPEGDA